ncbi:MAG: protein-L-isoaspartate(D-aspartate) O-methyltransferase [Deltaproteobacteria bacterium]|nr:protein-L-isoaspartate(D-aspartate) O-methyltransferase [Deltaproteobacteria bacterium]
MVESQIVPRGIGDERVIKSMLTVPRERFVEEGLKEQAYSDYPLPIGEGQTISQPYIVALMTESLALEGHERVLEIGTGSGYQTSILALLAEKIYTIERITALASRARKLFDEVHCSNVVIRIGDGTDGWPEEAPFEAIIVTAASPEVPETLLKQLADGGRLVIPVGSEFEQTLLKVTRRGERFIKESMGGCRFVKLIGRHGWSAKKVEGQN